jgi:hypothetical protein
MPLPRRRVVQAFGRYARRVRDSKVYACSSRRCRVTIRSGPLRMTQFVAYAAMDSLEDANKAIATLERLEARGQRGR